jgi:hypothetical protein
MRRTHARVWQSGYLLGGNCAAITISKMSPDIVDNPSNLRVTQKRGARSTENLP